MKVTSKCERSRKLSPRFCGSFQNLKRIGQMTFALNLPKDWKVHNVLHVSLLKRYMSNPNHVLSYLPEVVSKGEMLVEPERILQVDWQHLKNSSFKRITIK